MDNSIVSLRAALNVKDGTKHRTACRLSVRRMHKMLHEIQQTIHRWHGPLPPTLFAPPAVCSHFPAKRCKAGGVQPSVRPYRK